MRGLGVRELLPHRRRRRGPDPRPGGPGGRPRLRRRGAWSPTSPASATWTRWSTGCSWSGSCPRCAASCPTWTWTWSPTAAREVYEHVLGRYGGERCAGRVHARHLPRPARPAGHRRRARPAARGDRRDRQGVPARAGLPAARRPASTCPSCGQQRHRGGPAGPAAAPGRAAGRAAPPPRAAPVRGAACPTRRCWTAPRWRPAGWASR